MLTLSKDNPSPFVQPFLELVLAVGDALKAVTPGVFVWFIDVDGKIDQYISRDHKPTEQLVELCKSLAKAGIIVTGFSRYKGSAGPNMIMRNGALFLRVKPIEDPGEHVFAYEYREPKYRGPR